MRALTPKISHFFGLPSIRDPSNSLPSMLLVPKMNLDEREEGEITEYEDISSDEEIILRQRIAEIEELATLSNKGKDAGWFTEVLY